MRTPRAARLALPPLLLLAVHPPNTVTALSQTSQTPQPAQMAQTARSGQTAPGRTVPAARGDRAVPATPMQWTDLAPAARARLAADGLNDTTFAAFLDRTRADTDRRMIDGSFDHLVYYALQSTRLSAAPPIEPALSARTFVEILGRARVPDDAGARLEVMARALTGTARRAPRAGRAAAANAAENNAEDNAERASAASRLALCRRIVANAGLARASHATLRARLDTEYRRAMTFLYDKEFVAARAADSREATAALYHTRAHSTDTQIEAGFAVAEAIATLKALAPDTHISRLLIVGPGLDVAPRTGLLEALPPQSYQPFAVADALLAAGLADRAALRIDVVDINPLVVEHFERLRADAVPATLTIASALRDDAHLRVSEDFRRYVAHWGDAIGIATVNGEPAPRTGRGADDVARAASSGRDGRVSTGNVPTGEVSTGELPTGDVLTKLGARRVRIDPRITSAIHARRANLVTDRLAPDDARYDLVVITNVLPYLDETELTIALSNIAAALAPGGAFIHNEPRRTLLATSAALGLPAIQSRTVQIAAPVGGRPIFDTILLHRKN